MKLNIPDADFFVFENFLLKPEEALTWIASNEPWEQLYHNGYKAPRLNKGYGKGYTYSGHSIPDTPIPAHYKRLITKLEKDWSIRSNQILLNYYRNGTDSIGLHADDEKELGYNPTVVSLSLGDSRTFELVNKKTGLIYPIELNNNQLLIMGNMSQVLYRHRIRKQEGKGRRISITFRQVVV